MRAENTAKIFFEKYIGHTADAFLLLPQSGSARKNFIGEADGKKFVITSNDHIAENEAFLYFSNVFSELKLNTPQIFSVSESRRMYIQEFVGAQTLSEIIQQNPPSADLEFYVKQALDQLFRLQKTTAGKIDYNQTFEYKEYNRLPIWNDLFYFKNMFADVLELPYHKATLLLEFEKLTARIENSGPKTLMIRDFQARNMMVNEDGKVFFIDYQSCMKGPAMYDVISFLFQAKANFSAEFKDKMLRYYYQLWEDGDLEKELQASLQSLQFIRYLQVLGAYGFRGIIQKKSHFLNSIDQGVRNLTAFSAAWKEMAEFPELAKLIASFNSAAVQEHIQKIISGS